MPQITDGRKGYLTNEARKRWGSSLSCFTRWTNELKRYVENWIETVQNRKEWAEILHIV